MVRAQEITIEWIYKTVAIIAESLLYNKLAYRIPPVHKQESSRAEYMSLVFLDH